MDGGAVQHRCCNRRGVATCTLDYPRRQAVAVTTAVLQQHPWRARKCASVSSRIQIQSSTHRSRVRTRTLYYVSCTVLAVLRYGAGTCGTPYKYFAEHSTSTLRNTVQVPCGTQYKYLAEHEAQILRVEFAVAIHVNGLGGGVRHLHSGPSNAGGKRRGRVEKSEAVARRRMAT